MTQTDALNILKMGRNVFITGPAGSGKTYVINQYIQYLREHDVPLGITASTGIAATHIGGVTIHSWSGIGVSDRMSMSDIDEIASKSYVKKKIENAKVLLIDEVSMLHHFRLDFVDQVLRRVKKNDLPFGGIQVILCGDFFQLPPVARFGEPQAQFIYKSEAWKEGKFTICYLSTNYRQTDDTSLMILNEIRSGEVSENVWEHLQSRYNVKTTLDIMPTRLFTHNIDVDSLNANELANMSEVEFTYEMETRGKKPLVEMLKKSCLAPEILRLKKGARVMCVKNNFDKGYVNGTLGVVVSCGPNVDPIIRTGSSPDHPGGRLITLEKATWRIEDDGKLLAELKQYPLRLAWAITVHKSQGMSLDAAEMDLSKAFEPGMGYVALSRVRTMAGLTILGMNKNALMVHPEVLEFDRHLKTLSGKAESVLAYSDQKEILQAQEEFLAKVAPLYKMGDGLKSHRSARLKKEKIPKPPKISTYEKTKKLVLEKRSIKEIAKERGHQAETIVSHLEYCTGSEANELEKLTRNDIAYLKGEISFSHWGKLESALEEVSMAQKEKDVPPRLTPVKNKLGANVSFLEIRLARVILGYCKFGKSE